jgi:DNA-binding response OmpR family regulator
MEAPAGASPILLVEDDDGIRMMIELALGEQGYSVESAATVPDALRLAERLRPRLVLLDVRLNGFDGLAFADSYRHRPECAIVVMTASEDAAEAAASIHAEAFLAKPFDLNALYAIVDRYASGERELQA